MREARRVLIAEQRELRLENAMLRRRVEETPFAGPVIAESPRAQETLRKIQAVAGSDAPVLFSGETGTGKGLMAKVLFNLSHRVRAPFLEVNCGALHEQLIESELFGHRRGSFSGATESRAGLFEVADGGTLFLDEVGELSPPTQSSLLQVLDTKEFRPVGDTHLRRVDVRILAATNRDLETDAEAGRFRRDLFFRLSAVHIPLPPLRERRIDIPLLLEHYLGRFKHPQRGRLSFSAEAATFLRDYDWPGNVRELANLVESSVLLARGRVIGIDELPHRAVANLRPRPESSAAFQPRALAAAERDWILRTLEHTGGKKAPAARLLGIDIKTLSRKLREYLALD